jgi:hypothetical protein
LLRQGRRLQKGPQKERKVLPPGRGQGHEHGWQQLVGDRDADLFLQLKTSISLTLGRIHKSKYDETPGDGGKKKRARSKSRTRTMFGRIGGS